MVVEPEGCVLRIERCVLCIRIVERGVVYPSWSGDGHQRFGYGATLTCQHVVELHELQPGRFRLSHVGIQS